MIQKILFCPSCGLTVNAPAGEELPSDGPKCAMGHPPMLMEVKLVEVRQG